MFAQVALMRRMPRALGVLDYSIPPSFDQVLPGQIVFIPFRNKIECGMIISVSENTNVKKNIKEISSLVSPEPFLSPEQINFLGELSEMYATPLGFLIKNNLLPWQKRKISKLILTLLPKKEITKHLAPQVFVYENEESRLSYINTKFENNDQNLWLVPTVLDVQKMERILPLSLKEKTLFISSDLSQKQLFDAWLKLRQGEIKNVIGTRTAIFLPWQNLNNIILDDEGNANYKSWDMAPRFHTRDAALILSTHHRANLHLISHTPSVETLFFHDHKTYIGTAEMKRLEPTIQIVNEKEERRIGNYGFWNEEIRQAIKDSANEGDVFVYINRRGYSNYVGCHDCGYVAKCEKCQRTLVYHGGENILRCHYCNITRPQIAHCPDCHGVNVVMYGAGSELVENDAKKNWGDLFDIKRVDSDTVDFVDLKRGEKNQIIIGTQLAWDRIDWSCVKTFVWLNFDTQLFIPELQIIENSWQMLRSAQYRLEKTDQIFVQTGHPDHRLFQALYNPIEYYQTEWNERKLLKYPPFAYLLRLYAGDINLAAINQKSTKLIKELAILTQNHKDIIISGPLEMTPEYFEGQHWQVILFKIPYNFYKKYTKMIVGAVSDDWKVDPNPSTILNIS